MIVFKTPWNCDPPLEPICVNDMGNKFWLDPESQEWADRKGVPVKCLFIEFANGTRTRIIVDGATVIHEDTSMEGIACHIDALALIGYGKEKA